jgi:phosphate:Na+ symporter
MHDSLIVVFIKVLGALGLFIYGMKLMSIAVQRAAGQNLRKILNNGTSSKFKSITTGFLTTSLIQTSSATTVMVVSFVNAGIISLRKSFGLIMGANIGTTVKVWLIATIGYSLQTEDLALMITVPASFLLLSKNTRVKPWGDFLIGLAILLIGLFLLKELFPEVSKSTKDLYFLKQWATHGFSSVLLFIFIGFVLTVLIQSSSSAIAITILLCQQGIISFEMAAAMILGENIGTTITANIAAIVGGQKAKQAARLHFLFNIFGCIIVLPFFYFFTEITQQVVHFFGKGHTQIWLIPFMIATFHSGFNILNVLIQMNFMSVIEKISSYLVKNTTNENNTLKNDILGERLSEMPDLALLEIEKHIYFHAEIVSKIPASYLHLLFEQDAKGQSQLLNKFETFFIQSNSFKIDMDRVLEIITEAELSKDTSKKVRSLVTISNLLDEISTLFKQLIVIFERKRDEKIWFSPDQRMEIQRMLVLLDEAFQVVLNNLNNDNSKLDARQAHSIKLQIDAQREFMRTSHFTEAEEGNVSVKNTLLYTEIYTACSRAGDEIYSITEQLVGKNITSKGIRFKE